jgi:NitT/TauT family transport system substrate-binding protein
MLATNHRHRIGRTAGALLAAGTLVLLAACGGGDAEPGRGGGGGSAAETVSVTIGKAVDTIGFTAVDIAAEQGFFEEQGVEAKIVLLGGSAVANSALQSGDIQFSAAASLPLLLARQEGLPLISVASMDYGLPVQLIVSKAFADKADVSEDQPFDDRMKDLVGAKIGHVSATERGLMALFLQRAGLPADSVEMVSFQSAAAAVTAMQQGAVDGAMGSPPNTVAPVTDGKAVTVFSAREEPDFADLAYDILITTEDYAEQNADVTRRVATAVAQANNFMRTNVEETLRFEQKHFPSYSADALKQSLELVTFAEDGRQTAERWANAVKAYVDAGVLKPTEAPEGEVWTNEYIDLRN